MNMVWTTFRFNNVYCSPLTKFSQNLSYCPLLFSIKYLTAIFGGKNDMIFTIPFRMR